MQTLRWLAFPLVYAAIFLAAAMLFVLLLFSPWTKVQEIRVVRRDPRIDVALVQQALHPLFGRRMLLLGRADVLPLLQESMPDLQSVRVDVSYPSRLIISIALDPPIARAQIDDAGRSAQSGAVLHGFLTEKGIYMHYPPSSIPHAGELPLLRITDWGVHPLPGDRILSPTLLTTLQKTEELLRSDFGKDVTERLVFLRAREFHLLISGVWLWFDTRSSPEEHLQRYRTFLQSDQREHALEYVDLRPIDRVVYQ